MVNLTFKSKYIEKLEELLFAFGFIMGQKVNFVLNLDNIEQVCVSQMLILFWYGSKARLDFVLNLDNGGPVKQNLQMGYTIHRE